MKGGGGADATEGAKGQRHAWDKMRRSDHVTRLNWKYRTLGTEGGQLYSCA